jgi:hypothetical protein
MNPSPTARRRFTDRLQRDWYVSKVDFLAQDVPSGYRKARRRELRSDLTAAAADLGMSQAVRDLGPASVLAHQLKLAEGRKLPHVWTGIITFTIILYAWAGMIMATTYALLEAASQLGGDRTVTVHASWLGTNVVVTSGPHLLSGQCDPSALTLVVLIVAPLLAARAWRYRPAWLQRRLASTPVSASPSRRGDQPTAP